MRLRTKFQDEDFELGEVVDASIMYGYDDKIEVCCTKKMKYRKYNSIKAFTDHWEDAPEEPKEYWFIGYDAQVECISEEDSDGIELDKEIGNYFETKEEAEKAVERLRAWKRLKDKGFRFEGIKQDYTRLFNQQAPMRSGRKYLQFNKAEDEDWMKENWKDLDLLFGGEE